MRNKTAIIKNDGFSFHRTWSIINYELKWDLRKRKVLFTALFVVVVTILIGALFRTFIHNVVYGNSGYLWSSIVLVLTNGFIAGIFPMVLGGVISVDSMAWEIDKGTIIPLLSQPVSRSEIYFGKLMEKLFVMFLISLFMVILSVIVSTIVVGSQEYLIWVIPIATLFLLEIFVFVSFTFMLGALIKQSGFMMLMLTGIYFSILIGSVFLMLKQGFHLWMALIPLEGINNLLVSSQHFFIKPDAKLFVNYNLGPNLSGGAWVPTSGLLLYSIAGALFSIMIFTIIGYTIFSRMEIKG